MRLVLVLVVATAAVMAVEAASAAIVPNVSIGGARVGMTEKELRAALGAPRSVHRESTSAEFSYAKVTVVLVKGKVLGLTTKAPSEKVAGGIGVGSTEAKLKQSVKGLKCVVNFGTRVCNLLRPGHKLGQGFTEFFVDAGRISRISIRTGAPLTQS